MKLTFAGLALALVFFTGAPMAHAQLGKWCRPRQQEIALSPNGIGRESFAFP